MYIIKSRVLDYMVTDMFKTIQPCYYSCLPYQTNEVGSVHIHIELDCGGMVVLFM